jgi:hypothetical protein
LYPIRETAPHYQVIEQACVRLIGGGLRQPHEFLVELCWWL